MQGYGNSSYGDAFADVYDEWYGDEDGVLGPVEPVVAMLVGLLPPGGRALELGVGTGRLAIPLAAAVPGADVIGVDASEAMLALARAKAAGTANVRVVHGDMADDLPDGPFDLAFVAFNTLFNLDSAARQDACFAAVAERLAPDGAFVVDAAVPDDEATAAGHVSLRSMSVDRVVLSVARSVGGGRAEGQFVELTEAGGVRLRPWSIRSTPVAELDAMAAAAGLIVRERSSDFSGGTFDADSTRHVTVYARSAG